MVHDSYTVFWKEVREILRLRKTVRATVFSMVLPVVFIGFFLSANHGDDWVTGYPSLVIWFIIPYMMISGIIADSFAGERERHTLETLLATPLSETAIMTGKIIATMCYGIGLGLCGIAVSLVTVNLSSTAGHFLMFTPKVFFTGLAVSFLAALTAASAGILISLRASSPRQAQQMLGFAMMFVILIPVLTGYFVPEPVIRSVVDSVRGMSVAGIAGIVVGIVCAVDGVILAIARVRFKRSKMIFD